MLTTYEWAGEQHASESIKLLNGNIVSTNYFSYPFLSDRSNWTFGVYSRSPVLQLEPNTEYTFHAKLVKEHSEDEWGVFNISEGWATGYQNGRLVTIYNQRGPKPEIVDLTETFTTPDDGKIRFFYYDHYAGRSPEGQWMTDKLVDAQIVRSDLIGDYFDGDTPARFDETSRSGGWYVTHEWEGERHESASVKKVNGVATAWNLIYNPDFSQGSSNWTTQNGDITYVNNTVTLAGVNGVASIYQAARTRIPDVKNETPVSSTIRVRGHGEVEVRFGASGGRNIIRETIDTDEYVTLKGSGTAYGNINIIIYYYGDESIEVEYFQLEHAESASGYFDGDTQDYQIPNTKVYYDGKWVSLYDHHS